jgi:hypothetical protein
MIWQTSTRRRASNSGDVGDETGRTDIADPATAVSRRRIFKKAVGVAAVGAAGGSLLAEVVAPPALAATTTEQGAVAPDVVSLTDAPTIAVDASLGNDFRITLSTNRTMGNPTNPSDGQQIVFQVTQGTSGASAITWGSSYEFSSGLPQPSLSTKEGQVDLLGFVYNAALGKWLLFLFVNGFTGAPQQSGATYRLFPATNGPSSLSSYSGTFEPGVVFEVTSAGVWFEGYWWWVAPSGQATAPQEFVLWSMYSGSQGAIVPAATVTSGNLVSGQWNYVPLPAPVPLTVGGATGATSGSAVYIACTSFTGNFPNTGGQFGAGQPYGAGIVTGPLTAYSDGSGSQPALWSLPQGVFGTSDATAFPPVAGYQSSNFWMDLQVTTTPPAGASYRIWPNYPTIPGSISIDTGQQTFGTEFWLSEACTLNNIWFYSPGGSGVLPSRCGIFSVATQAEVSGTDNSSPSWKNPDGSAANPGDGWVYCSYSGSGVVLPGGQYKTCVYSAGGAEFYQENVDYFSEGPGKNNIVNGPLTCPSSDNAASPGQSTYQDGAWSYPHTFDGKDDGENRWVDVEVTPTS